MSRTDVIVSLTVLCFAGLGIALSTPDPGPISAPGQGKTDEAGAPSPEDQSNAGTRRLAALAQALEREGEDPSWSAEAERQLAARVQGGNIAGAQLIDASCGTTLCRVELALPVERVTERTPWDLHMLAPWRGGALVSMGQGNPATVVVFVAREGHRLPRSG